MPTKEKLLVSFSGGETSAFMTWWIWNNWQDKYEIDVVFANTSDENEETLLFVKRFSEHFEIPVTWIETVVFHTHRQSCSFRTVTFKTASRNGERFEDVVRKYGIPNQHAPHCTRELKQNPIKAYVIKKGLKGCFMAIGIRSDEVDRVSAKRKEQRILYPLISDRPMTKQKINFWWSQQPFRLELKGYQGNCKACYKKSLVKLYQIAKETPEAFDVFERIENKYSQFTPESRKKLMQARGEKINVPWRFYRGNKSVQDIKSEATQWSGSVLDDTKDTRFQFDILDYETDACEVFSTCGIDN